MRPMRLDLHTHTTRYSRGCSSLNPHSLVLEAMSLGLDGIAITEHGRLWSSSELDRLRRETGAGDLVLLRGVELDIYFQHILIFNYFDEIDTRLPLDRLLEAIRGAGGVVVLAHPFRFGRYLDQGSEAIEKALLIFDAVEILTPDHSTDENLKGLALHDRLGLVGTGGSDSHRSGQVGVCVTEFEGAIHDEEDLACAIREGRCVPRFGSNGSQV